MLNFNPLTNILRRRSYEDRPINQTEFGRYDQRRWSYDQAPTWIALIRAVLPQNSKINKVTIMFRYGQDCQYLLVTGRDRNYFPPTACRQLQMPPSGTVGVRDYGQWGIVEARGHSQWGTVGIRGHNQWGVVGVRDHGQWGAVRVREHGKWGALRCPAPSLIPGFSCPS